MRPKKPTTESGCTPQNAFIEKKEMFLHMCIK